MRRRFRYNVPMRTKITAFLLAVSVLLPSSRPAHAAEPRLLGSFRDWNAFVLEEPSGPACWMVSRPKKQEGDFARRGDVFVLVTHRPAEKALDVVNFIAGYPIEERGEVTVQIGKKSYKLFASAEEAWARDAETDRAIAQAMRQGTIMIVRGTSMRGTNTTDTFSLSGATAAYQAINAACGVAEGR